MMILGALSLLSFLLIPSSPVNQGTHNVVCTSALRLSVSHEDMFERSMQELGFSQLVQLQIRSQLEEAGFEGSQELMLLARDFIDRPEVFSELLQSDFGFKALMAHRVRAVAMDLLLVSTTKESSSPTEKKETVATTRKSQRGTTVIAKIGTPFDSLPNERGTATAAATGHLKDLPSVTDMSSTSDDEVAAKPTFKEVFVNEKARIRNKDSKESYGLPKDYTKLYPLLGKELEDFLSFMTKPSTASQESPIRKATADVYVRHAKQFVGWFVGTRKEEIDSLTVSIYSIVPSKEKESADPILEFILWLRSSRSISVSYEANLLRGLTKLLKFRFARESKTDPSYGEKSFDDIPLIRELRKLHRDANKRQGVSPRSSDEARKWLTWSEYLGVIQSLKSDLDDLILDYDENSDLAPQQRKIATYFQYYLVLSFFACVPDRQRTVRELQLGKSFVKDEQQNLWVIKHGPDDYKTGKTYGDRPPLVLSAELVPAIDEFIEQWRPCLNPKTESFFVQPRTGNPLTQDSVYQIVARNCYNYSGKKTNPHLLRDMIVTHVRDSDASEKQLEALALYMGHSIQMQRTSYDRRTLQKKVAPAVELLQNVNNMGQTGDLPSLG